MTNVYLNVYTVTFERNLVHFDNVTYVTLLRLYNFSKNYCEKNEKRHERIGISRTTIIGRLVFKSNYHIDLRVFTNSFYFQVLSKRDSNCCECVYPAINFVALESISISIVVSQDSVNISRDSYSN